MTWLRLLQRACLLKLACAAWLSGCALATPAGEAQPSRPVSIEDVLSAEFIGRAEFSPDGRWLAYNLAPAYGSLEDYSYWMRAFGLSGHQLWLKDMSAASPPFLQPGLDPAATHFLFGISPASTHVVVIEHRTGRLRLVACELGRDACVSFGPMPDIRDRYAAGQQWNERLAWTSDRAFVMPVRRPGLPGSEMRSRGAAGTFLWEVWNRAWSGQQATASEVISTARGRAGDVAEGELAEFDLATGSVRVIASGRHAGPVASPGGRWLLAAQVSERDRPPAAAEPVASQTHPVFDRRYALRLIDLQTGAVLSPAAPFHVDPASFAWRADSGAFAVFGWNRDELPEQGRFYISGMDRLGAPPVATGELWLTSAIADPGFRWWPGPARAVLLEDGLVVHGRMQAGEAAGWFLLRPGGGAEPLSAGVAMPAARLIAEAPDAVAALSQDAVYWLAPGTAPRRLDLPGAAAVTPLEHRRQAEFALSPEIYPMAHLTRRNLTGETGIIAQDTSGKDLLVAVLRPGLGHLQTLHVDLRQEGGHVLAASRAAGAVIAATRSGAATRLILYREDRPPERLAAVNAHLNEIITPGIRHVHYGLRAADPAAQPRQMSACLMLPPGFDPSRRYPVLMEIYPAGTGGNCRTFADAPGGGALAGDLWAARGFIYVRPAFPLDLARAPDDPLGNLGHLVDQTIDALAAEGYADPHRVVLYGASQGGAASLAAAVQSQRPAAVISVQGWANYMSHYFGARGLMRYFHLDQNGGDNRWRYECDGGGPAHGCPFGFGRTALSDPAAYAKASPVARAAEISAPVLLVHSDFDYFDMAQYDEMFGALYRAGREARYVRYWGEGHGLSSPANIRDLWARIDSFLAEHVGLEPE